MDAKIRWTALLTLCACLSACIEPSTTIRRERGASEYVRTQQASDQPGSGEQTYIVQGGDTLFRIAFRYQTTVDQLVNWNQIADRNRIQIGQRLRVAPPYSGPTTTLASSSTTANPTPTYSNQPTAHGVPADALPQVSTPSGAQLDPDTGVRTAGVNDATTSASTLAAPAYSEPQLISATEPVAAVTTAPSVVSSSAVTSASAAVAAIDPEATLTPPDNAISVAPATTPVASTSVSAAAPTAVRNGWSWPAAGRLIATFVAGDATRPGLDIAGSEGQAVYAAADGEVLFSGTGIIGYGELIVISHPGGLLSAYGHSRRRLVNEGAKIKRGQQIAEMGRDSSGRQLLHFEIRKAGKPVDPMTYLPGR